MGRNGNNVFVPAVNDVFYDKANAKEGMCEVCLCIQLAQLSF